MSFVLDVFMYSVSSLFRSWFLSVVRSVRSAFLYLGIYIYIYIYIDVLISLFRPVCLPCFVRAFVLYSCVFLVRFIYLCVRSLVRSLVSSLYISSVSYAGIIVRCFVISWWSFCFSVGRSSFVSLFICFVRSLFVLRYF